MRQGRAGVATILAPIPIPIGGHSDRAIDPAVRLGDGWIASIMSKDRLSDHLGKLRRAAERRGRDPDTVLVYVYGSEPNGRDPDTVTSLARDVYLPRLCMMARHWGVWLLWASSRWATFHPSLVRRKRSW